MTTALPDETVEKVKFEMMNDMYQNITILIDWKFIGRGIIVWSETVSIFLFQAKQRYKLSK